MHNQTTYHNLWSSTTHRAFILKSDTQSEAVTKKSSKEGEINDSFKSEA